MVGEAKLCHSAYYSFVPFFLTLTMRFPQLPVSLFLACIALVVTALPATSAELKVLTPEDFDLTVANGVWCVQRAVEPVTRDLQRNPG